MSPRVLRPALVRAACALAAGALAAAPAAAQRAAASPDVVRPSVAAAVRRAAPFAGRWELNADESAFGTVFAAPRAVAMGVRERRGALRVDVSQEIPGYGPVRAAHRFALDGGEGRRGDAAGRHLEFAGDTLVLTRRADRGGMRVVITDRWFLAANGSRLGMSRRVAADGAETEQFFVFDRRD